MTEQKQPSPVCGDPCPNPDCEPGCCAVCCPSVLASREASPRALEMAKRLFGGEPREVTFSVTLTLTNDALTDEQAAQVVVDCLVGGECIGARVARGTSSPGGAA